MMGKRTNKEWLSNLRSAGTEKDFALADLRAVIITGLPYGLSKWIGQNDPRFSPLIEEVAQETLIKVLEKIDSFEGRSQFTTWVHTIAVRIALTKLRKAKWREVSLEEFLDGEGPDNIVSELPDISIDVEKSVEKNEMIAMVNHMIKHDLTEKQRVAIIAVAIHGLPLEEVACRMGTKRNALYKLLHDARLKLKKQMEKHDISPEEISRVFEQ